MPYSFFFPPPLIFQKLKKWNKWEEGEEGEAKWVLDRNQLRRYCKISINAALKASDNKALERERPTGIPVNQFYKRATKTPFSPVEESLKLP